MIQTTNLRSRPFKVHTLVLILIIGTTGSTSRHESSNNCYRLMFLSDLYSDVKFLTEAGDNVFYERTDNVGYEDCLLFPFQTEFYSLDSVVIPENSEVMLIALEDSLVTELMDVTNDFQTVFFKIDSNSNLMTSVKHIRYCEPLEVVEDLGRCRLDYYGFEVLVDFKVARRRIQN